MRTSRRAAHASRPHASRPPGEPPTPPHVRRQRRVLLGLYVLAVLLLIAAPCGLVGLVILR
ncbi:hypothetical protein UG55_1008128 [Frankia sp. EI5c]|uniref:hypothetical protein n=1 Tax=Frankia sp. EI5c TaxID=683316 RepID=UPI0007C282C2|nr:hypothetical protein [Frankia sp. EI5c]OAA27477.1 hypothetical protein UG55_1008128 [Frankia sp. EI5c]